MSAPLDPGFERAVAMQRQAAIPDKSVFVSANAGSGKTRVLVDRVSRILLAGTAPDKILCLTYTKAAASEMQERLFAALGSWSIKDADALTKTLNNLEGEDRPRSDEELGRARRLFARALETPGGLKVQTIHAFCERLLTRFPLEAGLLPGTEAIDEREAKALYLQIVEQIQRGAVQDPEGVVGKAIRLLANHKADDDLDGLFGWMMGNSYKIDTWVEAGGIRPLAEQLGLGENASALIIMQAAWRAAPKAEIEAAANGMMSGGKSDEKKAAMLWAALAATSDAEAYNQYKGVFFTKAGSPNASIVTAKAGTAAIELFGDKKSGYQSESLRVIAVQEEIKSARVLELTRAIYDLAVLAVGEYRALKSVRRVMDFDDQIFLAKRLLTDSLAKDWVRYKLDGGVDHLLVDEAQDTSHTQWQIIDALSEEFFQPSPDRGAKMQRTLFAVGDEKQSIYSFQGAQPEEFLEKITALHDRQKATPDVRMNMSFRSVPEILKLVDQIFYAHGGIADSFVGIVALEGEHVAHRSGPGVVEFWPAVKAPEKPEPETAWKPEPVDAPSNQSTREQLARQIAVQIRKWLETGEPVFDRGEKKLRPMQARDIMILVTKRLPFFDAIIRNLKEQGVPVAGADRLQLTDSIAVQDLLSLAKFTLLPTDDLSLAEVLKSPLFGWTEQALFEIAHDRGDASLWQVLPVGDDKNLLKRLQGLAARRAPYEFFARSLALVPIPGGPSLLQRIYNRTGIEAADALEAFLDRALAHQRRTAPSLSRFVSEIMNDEDKIKREMDTAQNEVRVMTVHAAKGLEAPVVILPDTTQLPSAGRDLLYPTGGGFVINVNSAGRPEAIAETVESCRQARLREHMRLLYVALTRAESRLLVCGYESNHKVAEGSWHDRIGAAMVTLAGAKKTETPFGDGLQLGRAQKLRDRFDKENENHIELPKFLRQPVPSPTPAKRRLTPSNLITENDLGVPVRSPLEPISEIGLGRFGRGNIIHKLLQILPDLQLETRRPTAKRYLEIHSNLTTEIQVQIEQEVFAVLEHEDYAPFFAKGSQAEIALVGSAVDLPENVELNGQIDRLCVRGDTVWVLDYKSNRPPPASEDYVSEIYIRQMAAYRSLVRELYPSKRVICALLWTDGPRLMPLSDTVLDNVCWDVDLPS